MLREGDKYQYNYDLSLNWLIPPGPYIHEVLEVFNHEKHGHVVKVAVYRNGRAENNRWLRYEEFKKDIERGEWSLIN